MTWKFWTWFRRDDAYRTAKPNGDDSSSDQVSHEPEDILAAISELIVDHSDEFAESIRMTPSMSITSKIDFVAAANAMQAIATGAVGAAKTIEESKKPELNEVNPVLVSVDAILPNPPVPMVLAAVPTPERNPIPTVDPPKQVREPSTLNRDAARKDPRKTLVAEDGQWPTFKGLSEGFSDLENAEGDPGDTDEFDGPSPFQTIVPNDD